MANITLQKTSVTPLGGGEWNVELTIADNSDTATARDAIVAKVVVGPFPRSLYLEEIQEAALLRIQEVAEQSIRDAKKRLVK